MKQAFTRLALSALLAACASGAARAQHRLVVALEPRFNCAPLSFDALTNTTPAGQEVSVTRLDFLLSSIALRQADRGWLGLTNWSAYLSPREGRSSFELNNLPAARYDRIRFCVGVPAEANHSNPADYPAEHPLNPIVNGLHWSWQGGYVFLALEGDWRSAGGPPSGYSYHIATDHQLTTVELELALDLSSDREVRLTLDVARILSEPNRIVFTEATAATHSREGDALASQLHENLARAFAADAIGAAGRMSMRRGTNTVEVGPDATPYRLAISRHFPRPALPTDNPLTEEGVALGRLLFLDPRLSENQSQSCASCHEPARAFTDGKAVSTGAEGSKGTRSAMPLLNLAWKSLFFWDGRAPTLREQVLQPIQNPIEMHQSLTNLAAVLQSAGVNGRHQARAERLAMGVRTAAQGSFTTARRVPTDYPSLFASAFGSPDITADRVARALEQFLLTQVSCDSKFDRSLRGEAELSEEEKRGFLLFHTE